MEEKPRPAADVTISLMLAVPDAEQASLWYQKAFGAEELWNLGSVRGLTVGGAPFFLHEPTEHGFHAPPSPGETTVRVELMVGDIEGVIERALASGAEGNLQDIRSHEAPWGMHRQGSFIDPFGHVWLVGDKSPLKRHPADG